MQNGVRFDHMLPINVFPPSDLETTSLLPGIRCTDNHREGDDYYDAAIRTSFVTLSALLQLAALLKARHGSPHLISMESRAFSVEMYRCTMVFFGTSTGCCRLTASHEPKKKSQKKTCYRTICIAMYHLGAEYL